MKNTTKQEILIVILALIYMWALGAKGAELTAKDVAKWNIPGEREKGQCLTYAFCLNIVLAEHGIKSRIVGCDYDSESEGHAIVLFELSGKTYFIDNERDTAIAVKGRNDLARVRRVLSNVDSVRNEDPAKFVPAKDALLFLVVLEEARTQGKF